MVMKAIIIISVIISNVFSVVYGSSMPEKHLVFDVQGTLVQGVPFRKAKTMHANELIKTQETWNGKSVTKNWGVLPNTRESITRLYNFAQAQRAAGIVDIKISYFSSDPDFRIDKILDELKLTDASGKSFNDIAFKKFYRKDTTELDKDEKDPHKRWKKDLTKISPDLDNIILITSIKDHAIDADGTVIPKNVFWTGTKKFFYDTYYEASVDYSTYLTYKDEKNAWKEQHFPKDESEWYLDRHKMSYIYLILQESLEGDDTLRNEIAKRIKETRRFVTRVGKAKLDGSYKQYFYEWVKDTQKKKLTACEKKSLRTDKVQARVDIVNCIDKNKTKYYWQEKKRDVCLQFTDDLYYIAEADKGLCKEDHILKDKKNTYIVQTFFYIDGKLESYIPEVLDMRDNSVLDQQVLKKYSADLIAKSLLKRMNLEYEPSVNARSADYNFKKDSEIHMAIWEQYIDSINKNCFMNQHQVGHSKGYLGQPRRAAKEDEFLGVKLESSYNYKQSSKTHVIRPKYAYFVLQKKREDMILTDQSTQYGNVIAKFKDHIKERVSFSGGDSLGMNGRDIKSIHYSSRSKLRMTGSSYWEAQIWGKVCVDKDVDYFLVNCPHYSSVSSSAIAKLKKTGKPVYKCEVETSGGKNWRTYRGRKL